MKNQSTKEYSHRYLARFIIEAETPIAVGSGEKDIETDSLVALDVNGLPYLPGTTIAGVVRSMFNTVDDDPLWGYQKKDGGHGSEIIFTEGRILNSKGEVIDGLKDTQKDKVFDDALLRHYAYLPIRQHVRITGKGVADNAGKFDEQVVYAGTRFCFEIEMVSDGNNKERFDELIRAVRMETFRIGGGSRKGFGKIKVVSVQTKDIDLIDKTQADLYLEKSSNLQESADWHGWTAQEETDAIATNDYITYHIELHPQDFIFFGSGLADEKGDADMTTVKAKRIHWDSETCGRMQEDLILIPASSLKGALRHRVAYNFNKIKGYFVDTKEGIPDTPQNEAVRALFGFADEKVQQRGEVIFADIIVNPEKQKTKAQPHLFNHVAIDRFTGGTINGALFTEQADYVAGQTYETDILVRKDALKDSDIKAAWERTLDDLHNGLLPLGGSTNRGHGIFNEKEN